VVRLDKGHPIFYKQIRNYETVSQKTRVLGCDFVLGYGLANLHMNESNATGKYKETLSGKHSIPDIDFWADKLLN
jgi:uncharacterized protein YukJ